jgi:hypothetical protein
MTAIDTAATDTACVGPRFIAVSLRVEDNNRGRLADERKWYLPGVRWSRIPQERSPSGWSGAIWAVLEERRANSVQACSHALQLQSLDGPHQEEFSRRLALCRRC